MNSTIHCHSAIENFVNIILSSIAHTTESIRNAGFGIPNYETF